MTIIKRRMFRNDFPKGYWQPVVDENGKRSATMTCPDCGALMGLINHSISPDGTVSPSVVAPANPHTACPCGFHDFVKLELWEVG